MLNTQTSRSIAPFALLAVTFSALSAISPLPCYAQTFVAVSSPAIASHVGFSTGAAWVDYDGDGDLDLYVVTAFGANNDNVLYRNDGGSVFTRITAVPLTSDGAFTVCSTWADVDNDGDLDCFVSGLDSAGGALYRSSGGGVLTLDPASGVTDLSIKATGCAFGDYDADGHVDLVLSLINGALGMSGGNRLFHNDGDGTFTEVVVALEGVTAECLATAGVIDRMRELMDASSILDAFSMIQKHSPALAELVLRAGIVAMVNALTVKAVETELLSGSEEDDAMD